MVKSITERQRLALKLEHMSDTEVHEVLDYIALMESTRRATPKSSTLDDELVSLLADSQENERARQAFEWESVRRRAERHAALSYAARA
ncbi:MAG: hypothetical protein QOJ76_2448 [Acidobacteriota bacterium]|jgi:hypothetical protein|nr:hypothetical protein [Acidobacteriota bacterium]